MGYGVPLLATLPIDPAVARLFDEGRMEEADLSAIAPAATLISRA